MICPHRLPQRIRRPILALLTASFVLLLVLFAFSAHWMYWQQESEELQAFHQQVASHLPFAMAKRTFHLENVMAALGRVEALQRPFLRGDRLGLLEAVRPLFAELRKRGDISHLYFFDPRGVVVLRAHAPDQFGDRTPQVTLGQAMRNESLASGLEMGSLGILTLRVVAPWRVEGRLIGFLELGVEWASLQTELANRLGVEMFTFLDKSLLQRQVWEQGLAIMGRRPQQDEWERLDRYVVLGGGRRGPSAVLIAFLDRPGGYTEPEPWRDLLGESVNHMLKLPLLDAGQRTVGWLGLQRSQTALSVPAQRHVRDTALAMALITLALFGFSYWRLGGMERNLLTVQRELERGAVRHQAIMDTALDGVISIDRQGRVVEANQAVERLSGFSRADMLGREIAETIVPPELREAHHQGIARFLATGESRVLNQRLELPLQHAAGHRVPIEIAITTVRLDEEVLFTAYLRDITERKAMAQALADSERQYRTIVETSQEGIWVIDPLGVTRFVNQRLATMLGRRIEELLDHPFVEFIDPLSQEEARRLLSRRRQGVAEQLDFRFRRPSGEEVWALLSSGPLYEEGGRFAGVLAMVADISERKRMEVALSESEARFRGVAAIAPVGVFQCDPDGVFLYVNPRCMQLTGQTLEQLPATGWHAALHPQDRAWVTETWRQAIDDRRLFQAEFRLVNAGGERWVLGQAAPQIGFQGVVVGWVGALTDIHELKHMAEELRASKEQAEAANRAKGEFLAAMSHEIRTPMNVMLGMSEVLLEGELVPEQRHYAEMMHHSGGVLLEIINDILDYSRIEAGRFVLVEAPLQPAQVVAETVRLLGVTAREKGLTLTTRVSSPATATLLGDEARLRQVLLNLVSNAIKFTEQGEVCVELSVAGDPPELVLTVADTGIGIATDQLESIFDHFTQADAGITRRFGGTGLGLAIARRLVALMGGRLSVTSRVGEGSLFRVALPMRPVAAGEQTSASTGGEEAAVDARPLRILLVEDSRDNQTLIRTFLKPTPHQLEVADNGEEAVLRTRRELFDLVLMDVQMPVMDGYTATRLIRQRELETGSPRLPIVALTAHVMEGEEARSYAAGCDLYLAKPLKKSKLLETLRQLAAV